MKGSRNGAAPLPHRFMRGAGIDAVLLLPLATASKETRHIVRFCRRISPGAPILLPHIDPGPERPSLRPQEADNVLLARIACLIERITVRHGLALVPVLALGHAAGADFAVQLTSRHDALVAACILLRPVRRAPLTAARTLRGVPVLLGRSAGEEAVGTVGWQVCNALRKAGAELVCERVLRRQFPGGRDDVIARVFLATLFKSDAGSVEPA